MTDLWKSLAKSHSDTKGRAILDLFKDEKRAADFSARLGDMLFDYSKTNIDAAARDQLLALAAQAGVAGKRDAMFAGAVINETEGRAVLHTALRNLNDPVMIDGHDVMPAVRATHNRMEAFCEDVRAGRLVPLLLEHLHPGTSVFAVYPENRHLSPKVRAVIDWLAEELGPEPEWDRDLPVAGQGSRSM